MGPSECDGLSGARHFLRRAARVSSLPVLAPCRIRRKVLEAGP